jgi:copper transporter 1
MGDGDVDGNRMLAVMTMNVGYFMSVLAGVFVGELAWGRYILSAEH